MRYRPVVRAAAGAAIVVIMPAFASAQDRLRIESARVTLAGTSNLHDYTASTTEVRLQRVRLALAAANEPFWDAALRPGALEEFAIVLPAASLTSPRDGLDKNMHRALKVRQHPDITFTLVRLGGAGDNLRAAGRLQVAGVEREVTLPLSTAREGELLMVRGGLDVLMTDYGIAPPKALMGMVRAHPRVAVSFEVRLARLPATDAQNPGKPGLLRERPITIQHFRPLDRRGINVFETPKTPGVEFTGFKLDWGAAFTSQVQSLSHTNTSAPVVVNGVNTNQLADIGFGFNNSTANLYLNAQLAEGIRVTLTSYLSARHHNETWVKDGYLLVDASPLDIETLHRVMQYVTLRIGHFEINYGDAHFRRSDNGNAMYNPFVGNYVMDAFTTEVGAEVYVRHQGLLGMAAVTGGEIRGTVLSPGQRGPAVIGKLGFDRQVRPDVRLRLTGSLYRTDRALNNTLYGGDRAGSRYYYVLENTAATESAQFTSGHINPGFRNSVTAFQINPFIKAGGLEVFGVLERAEGRTRTETADRRFTQKAVDVVYRALDDAVYVGLRYNTVKGRLAGLTSDVESDRWQAAAGLFLTSSLLLKAEFVHQAFAGYPVAHIRHGGEFMGLIFEGVVAF